LFKRDPEKSQDISPGGLKRELFPALKKELRFTATKREKNALRRTFLDSLLQQAWA